MTLWNGHLTLRGRVPQVENTSSRRLTLWALTQCVICIFTQTPAYYGRVPWVPKYRSWLSIWGLKRTPAAICEKSHQGSPCNLPSPTLWSGWWPTISLLSLPEGSQSPQVSPHRSGPNAMSQPSLRGEHCSAIWEPGLSRTQQHLLTEAGCPR